MRNRPAGDTIETSGEERGRVQGEPQPPPLSALSLSLCLRWEERSSARLLSTGYKKCGACSGRSHTATQEKRNDLPWSRSKMLDGHLLLGWLSVTVIVYFLGQPGPTAAYFG